MPNSVMGGVDLQQFDIRNFIDCLTPTKTKGKYICPVCGGNDLSVDDETGKYQCWHGCECADIREAIAPWDEVKGQRRQPTKFIPHRKKSKPSPAPLPEEIKLARFIYFIEHPQKIKKGDNSEIVYQYSDHQWVVRVDKSDGSKITIPHHIDSEGNEVRGKGDNPWTAYRQDEAIEHGKGKFILGVEGEKCVEAARFLGLVSITWQGGSWTDEALQTTFTQLKDAGVAGIVYHPDNDEPGTKKAEKVEAAAAAVGFPCLVVDPLELWDNCPPKGDIADWVRIHNGTDKDTFTGIIREVIEKAAKARLSRSEPPEASRTSNPEPEKLSLIEDTKREIKRLLTRYQELQSQNSFEAELELAMIEKEIYQKHKISRKRLESMLSKLSGENSITKPIAQIFDPEQLFSNEGNHLPWLFPGLLPGAGVTVLGGDSGVGKSTLAYDLAGAFIYDEEFLGEKPTRTGKVLIVSSDEPKEFAVDKLINRGVTENFRFVTDWDVSQWDLLEKAIEDYHPDLVIIDSFSAIHTGGDFDENSSKANQTIYTLNRLLSKYSCCALLIHHLSKSKDNKGVNKLRGSSAIAAASSMVWLMEPSNNPSVKHFSQPKTRGTQPLNFKIELEADTGRYTTVGGKIYDDETLSLSARIIALFESLEPGKRLEFTEIKDKVSGNSDGLRKALTRLVKTGQLVKRLSKFDKRKKVWGLPKLDSSNDNDVGQRHTPSPHSVDSVQQYAETIDTQGIEILDNSWTKTKQTLDESNKSDQSTNSVSNHSNQDTVTDTADCPVNSPVTPNSVSNNANKDTATDTADFGTEPQVEGGSVPCPQSNLTAKGIKERYEPPAPITPEDAIALLTDEFKHYVELASSDAAPEGITCPGLKGALDKAADLGLCQRDQLDSDLFRLN